ncbi:hypothetical protein JXB01_02420 [Candidatus Micrarchaeota archaeon]|nr:hypothetical protein [Candidatus Micrarchaeota archaeon]
MKYIPILLAVFLLFAGCISQPAEEVPAAGQQTTQPVQEQAGTTEQTQTQEQEQTTEKQFLSEILGTATKMECTAVSEAYTYTAQIQNQKSHTTITMAGQMPMEMIVWYDQKIYFMKGDAEGYSSYTGPEGEKCDWIKLNYGELEQYIESSAEEGDKSEISIETADVELEDVQFECHSGAFDSGVFTPTGNICDITDQMIQAFQAAKQMEDTFGEEGFQYENQGSNPCEGLTGEDLESCEEMMSKIYQ